MKRSTKCLFLILGAGIVYSLFRAVSGEGGSGMYDFIDAIVYTSIVLFLVSLVILLISIRNYKQHADTLIFLIVGLPLTIAAIRTTIDQIHYNRTPDLTVKYELPVTREQYVFDSTNIQLAIDSMIALRNRSGGGLDVQYGLIDTIIYSQAGDKIFVSYMTKFERNHLGYDLHPGYFAAEARDSTFWKLTETRYSMTGSFHDRESLKRAVRKFYFNQFRFRDKDSAAQNYFWKVIL